MARSAPATTSDVPVWQWLADAVILTVPDLHGSGPGHWQTRWKQRFLARRRMEQAGWSTPDLSRWFARVGEAVRAALAERPSTRSKRPVILVAHSFGCLALLHWAVQTKEAVAAVLLVAPAGPDKFGVRDLLLGHTLPFPVTLIANRNDPWMPQGSAIDQATRRGTEFVGAGEAGHINADSNLGNWDDGSAVLDRLIGRASAQGTTHDGADWQAQWDVLPSTSYI